MPRKQPSKRRVKARLRLGAWVGMRNIIDQGLDWQCDHVEIDFERELVRRYPATISSPTLIPNGPEV